MWHENNNYASWPSNLLTRANIFIFTKESVSLKYFNRYERSITSIFTSVLSTSFDDVFYKSS